MIKIYKEAIKLSKKSSWDWLSSDNSDDEVHHEEWPWDEDDGDENDESYGAEDYYTSRPWTDE